MSAQLGLDKLQFLLPADEIAFTPDFPATIENPFNAATGEALSQRTLYTAGGRAVTGRKAKFFTDDFQLQIVPDRAGAGSLCSVQFSAGAFRGSNLEPLGVDECFGVARRVERTLKDNGATLNLSRARLARLDIAQNVRLSHPISCYSYALSAVGARKRVRKMDFGGTGFIVGNKTWEAGFYDKGAQMKELGYAVELRPVNSLRPELRLMRGRLIKSELSCEALPELRRAWPQLKPTYIRFLKRDVFRSKFEQKSEASIDFHRLARFVCDGSPRRPWHHFKSEGLPLLMVQQMGLGAAQHFAATEFGYDASTDTGSRQIERMHAELAHADFALKMQSVTRSGHKVDELYKELRERVLSV